MSSSHQQNAQLHPRIPNQPTARQVSAGQEPVPYIVTGDFDADLELQILDGHDESLTQDQKQRSSEVTLDDSDSDHDLQGADPLIWSESFRRPPSRLQRVWLFSRNFFNRVLLFDRKKSQSDRKKTVSLPRAVWRVIATLLMIMGVIQVASLWIGILTAFFPEKLDFSSETWQARDDLDDLSHWPTDYTADITPAACHSHNDYWRRRPLKSAIQAGCTGVEADVWLVEADLYVGHAKSALEAKRTLTNLYIDPLVQILDRQNPTTEFQVLPVSPRNGVFDTDASQTLILLIDFKTSYEELWPVVSAQLEPLRKRRYLTFFNGTTVHQGPITVVVTGNAPFDYVVRNMTYRDMFFDAPLDRLASLKDSPPSSSPSYNPNLEHDYLSSINDTGLTDANQGQGHSGHPPSNPAIFHVANSYYASVDFAASIGYPNPYLSRAQRDKITAQIAGAHAQGLKVRYWGVPNWPVGLRNYLWRELVKMGADILNVDDLYSATRGDWKGGVSIWDWSLWGSSHW